MMLNRLMAGWALLALLSVGTNPVRADVLTFDDLPNEAYLPAGYGGFNWGPGFASWQDNYLATEYGWGYGAPSASTQVTNGGDLVTTVTRSGGDTFDFLGAFFTGWGENDTAAAYTATSLTVEGYNNGNLIGSVSLTLRPDRYDWLEANLMGVDTLRFVSSSSMANYSWWFLDNFTFNKPVPQPPSQVPEPTSLSLLGLGALGLAGWTARRRKQS